MTPHGDAAPIKFRASSRGRGNFHLYQRPKGTTGTMAQTTANLIWKIADLLRGPYQPNQ